MNKGYITLNLEESLQEELLELDKTTIRRREPIASMTESTELYLTPCSDRMPAAEPLKAPASQQEKEKTLLKLYINFGVLSRLGYEEERVLKVSTDSLRLAQCRFSNDANDDDTAP